MNKKADIEISETIRLLLYILIAILIFGMIYVLWKYLFTEIDFNKIFERLFG